MPVSVSIAAAALLAASFVGVPTVIAPGCDVTDATLTWGFKESFRAYIDSDIANGEWTTADGASYATPDFGWSGGTGRYDPENGTGFIQFTGSVRFTGHDGLLDTTIADPFVRFDGGSGALLLDVSGPTMDGTPINLDDVEFVAMPALQVVGGDAIRTVDADTVLTDAGAVAFPNYETGTAFDPVAIAMTVGKMCAATGLTDVVDAEGGDDGSPQIVGPIAGGVALGIAAIVGIVFATRRRGVGA